MNPTYPNDDRTRIKDPFNLGSSPPPVSCQDDMWFVVDLPGKTSEYPIRPGELITVGRDESQNIVIDDKTLSREHLTLQRNGDRVRIQVQGLNGCVHNGQVYKSTTIEIIAPASITLGKTSCRIKKQLDTEATIMIDPLAAGKEPSTSGAGGLDPFDKPSPPSFSQPSSGLGGLAEPTIHRVKTDAPGYNPPGTHPDHKPQSQGSSDLITDNQPHSIRQPQGFGPCPDTPGKNGKLFGSDLVPSFLRLGLLVRGSNRLWLGVIALALLLIGGGVFYWWNSQPRKVASGVSRQAGEGRVTPQPMLPPQPVPAQRNVTITPSPDNNLHARIYSEAVRLVNEKNFKDACDYLKDIPAGSAYRERAIELAQRIGACKLDE